ncbi:97b4bd1b-6afb-42cf-938b-597b1a1f8aeb [Thermothielavioides terrestris]|uniref:97b4bd1b-6afb-42cf-938b-597b1a1f8aeb n=1 Tax=Thermothielavioides terrestris TaxID=2587410 RepID=A0A446BV27_9PEZI|nr:97b4bd1b-6afb-42cf-938b-597b1a1f8aeb [Thermothielavioides terrestris]
MLNSRYGHLPARELVGQQPDELHNGHILEQLPIQIQVRQPPRLAVCLGGQHEGHVLLHVASGPVVATVRELPAEIRHQQRQVHRPARHVVQPPVDRAGAVADLVRQDPDAHADEALDIPNTTRAAARQAKSGIYGMQVSAAQPMAVAMATSRTT